MQRGSCHRWDAGGYSIGMTPITTNEALVDFCERLKGAPFITVDTVGAGEGEIVMWAGGSSSRQTDLTTNKPVDSSIVGIVDFVDILGKRVYDKGNAS